MGASQKLESGRCTLLAIHKLLVQSHDDVKITEKWVVQLNSKKTAFIIQAG